MKITAIKTYVTMPPGASTNHVFVKVETDEGLVGWGECTMGAVSVEAVVREIGALVIGRDPFRIEENWQTMYNFSHNVRGGVFHSSAISGIEIALWDIKGKALGVPVYELLGGAMRERFWAYGRFDGSTPEACVANAENWIAKGFTALKGDPFAQGGFWN
jgi:galactonate dehydratase